jgi:pentatricopeptide repeat protein
VLQALEIFNEMQSRKQPAPNVFTYNILLSVLARNKDYQAAMDLFDQVRLIARSEICAYNLGTFWTFGQGNAR